MLGLLRRRAGLASLLLMSALLSAGGPSAAADGGECKLKNPKTGVCLIWADDPPSPPGDPDPPGPPGGGGGGDPQVCTTSSGLVVQCYLPGFGYYDQSTQCYYDEMEPQPPAGHPGWQGHEPGDGAVYFENCIRDDGTFVFLTGVVWRAAPPGPPPVDPEVLAQRAILAMQLLGPIIRTAPPQGSDSGLVGLPAWMWSERAENVTGPISRTESEGTVTVTAIGVVAQVVWSMGDGQSVTCGAGTPYPAGSDGESPDCGYTYQTASTNPVAGGGPWPITATSTWTITWSGGGESGTETLELTSTGELLIRELYVLNQDGG